MRTKRKMTILKYAYKDMLEAGRNPKDITLQDLIKVLSENGCEYLNREEIQRIKDTIKDNYGIDIPIMAIKAKDKSELKRKAEQMFTFNCPFGCGIQYNCHKNCHQCIDGDFIFKQN